MEKMKRNDMFNALKEENQKQEERLSNKLNEGSVQLKNIMTSLKKDPTNSQSLSVGNSNQQGSNMVSREYYEIMKKYGVGNDSEGNDENKLNNTSPVKGSEINRNNTPVIETFANNEIKSLSYDDHEQCGYNQRNQEDNQREGNEEQEGNNEEGEEEQPEEQNVVYREKNIIQVPSSGSSQNIDQMNENNSNHSNKNNSSQRERNEMYQTSESLINKANKNKSNYAMNNQQQYNSNDNTLQQPKMNKYSLGNVQNSQSSLKKSGQSSQVMDSYEEQNKQMKINGKKQVKQKYLEEQKKIRESEKEFYEIAKQIEQLKNKKNCLEAKHQKLISKHIPHQNKMGITTQYDYHQPNQQRQANQTRLNKSSSYRVTEKIKEEAFKDIGTRKTLLYEFVDRVAIRSLYLYKNNNCQTCAQLLSKGKSTSACPKCH